MKFTLSWLHDHLETRASLEEICEALTDLGLEVEDVSDPAERLGDFRICRVAKAEPHPNADRLTLCQVETWPDGPGGATEIVQVVCGAPNAREGLVGVFASAGTHIPGTGLDLKAGVIRGAESNGMLCSGRELLVNDDHDGIIDLPADAPLGERFIDYAGRNDPVVDFAVTPNRPDALGIRGVARDLAARGIGTLKPAAIEPVAGCFPSPIGVSIDADVQARGCPAFMGRVIRGVRNTESPDWLKDRLQAIGLRPISAVVDITNYLTHDRNRPLHAFDADIVSGDLRVHFARGGERITALDDRDYEFEAGMMVISDANGPESIGGVMGGRHTGCTHDSTNIFIESALWDPAMIAATGRRLKIVSDARYRFERGVDPEFAVPGLELATRMILEICGGEPSEIVAAGKVPDTARSYRLDPDRVRSLAGMDVAPDDQAAILEALGFRVEGDRVHVPSWRPDVLGEPDLVEEIARVRSLGGLEGVPLPRKEPGVQKPVLLPMQRREAISRRAAAALGYNECVTYSFIDKASAVMFGGGGDATMLANPIASDMSHMRPDLMPGLLQAAARNQARGHSDLALFEVGPVFHGGEPEDQEIRVTGLLVGNTGPRDPYGARRPVDMGDASADAVSVLAAVGAPDRLTTVRAKEPWWHPGRAGALNLGPRNTLASFGELHPRVLAAAGVSGSAVAFVVHLDRVPQSRAKSATRPAFHLHELQAVERDFAFVVDSGVEAAAVVRAARGVDRKLIADVAVFDEFAGAAAEAQFGPGRKSIAINVRLQPQERTLTDGDIEEMSSRIVDRVAAATGGELRG